MHFFACFKIVENLQCILKQVSKQIYPCGKGNTFLRNWLCFTLKMLLHCKSGDIRDKFESKVKIVGLKNKTSLKSIKECCKCLPTIFEAFVF